MSVAAEEGAAQTPVTIGSDVINHNSNSQLFYKRFLLSDNV